MSNHVTACHVMSYHVIYHPEFKDHHPHISFYWTSWSPSFYLLDIIIIIIIIYISIRHSLSSSSPSIYLSDIFIIIIIIYISIRIITIYLSIWHNNHCHYFLPLSSSSSVCLLSIGHMDHHHHHILFIVIVIIFIINITVIIIINI